MELLLYGAVGSVGGMCVCVRLSRGTVRSLRYPGATVLGFVQRIAFRLGFALVAGSKALVVSQQRAGCSTQWVQGNSVPRAIIMQKIRLLRTSETPAETHQPPIQQEYGGQ
jgi:hypothetical protein